LKALLIQFQFLAIFGSFVYCHNKSAMKTIADILLIEDDEVDIMNVQRAFKNINLYNKLYIRKNGLEALQFLKEEKSEKPIIILLDINMPKMNGIEFLQEIRKDDHLKSLPVFVMTTSNQEQDIVAAYNLNVAGYIVKPVSFGNFLQAITILNHYWELCEMP